MTDVSAGFRPPCWCPSRWAPTWRLHTNLYKFEENVSPHISHKKNCCDLNLGESLCISTFFLFPGSRLDLLNGFDFLFWSILNGVTLKTSNSVHCVVMQGYSLQQIMNRWKQQMQQMKTTLHCNGLWFLILSINSCSVVHLYEPLWFLVTYCFNRTYFA